jgi:hypothetical protein
MLAVCWCRKKRHMYNNYDHNENKSDFVYIHSKNDLSIVFAEV